VLYLCQAAECQIPIVEGSVEIEKYSANHAANYACTQSLSGLKFQAPLLERGNNILSSGGLPPDVGAVYDRARSLNLRRLRGHRPRLHREFDAC
jgi:hypothetical protein